MGFRSRQLNGTCTRKLFYPLQMSGGTEGPGTSTRSWSAAPHWPTVDELQQERGREGGGVEGPRVPRLNISRLHSRPMNYSAGAICWASHLKHLPCQPVCERCWLTLLSCHRKLLVPPASPPPPPAQWPPFHLTPFRFPSPSCGL